jgi:hypothetical protein
MSDAFFHDPEEELLSEAAYTMQELLPPQMFDILFGNTDGSEMGIHGFVAECHRLALHRHVTGFGPKDIVALIRLWPDCRWRVLSSLECDVAKCWEHCLSAAREEIESRTRASELAKTLFDPWADLPPPEWPPGVLPPDYEETIAALATRDGCDFGVLAMAFVMAISGAAHKAMRFQPVQHAGWRVPPIISVMPIADSGFRKTVLTNTAFAAIRRRDNQQWQAYQQALAEWEASDDKRNSQKPEEPAPLIVDDILVEKLQTVLARSPRGALMLRDEIAPMFDFHRYSRGNGAAERAFYLTAYEGGTSRVHRIGRPTDHGDVGLAVFGCCQPDRLADFKDLGSDGLMQRFVPLVIARHRLSEPDTIVRGHDKLDAAIDLLMAQQEHEVYCTTPEGSALIRETEIAGQALSEITDYGKTFQGFCGKLHGLHARLAFLLHLLDDPGNSEIPVETITRAARLTTFCVAHARAFYSRAPGSVLEITKAVAGYILTRPAPIGGEPERIVASTLTGNVRVCRGMTLKRLTEVLSPLVAGGWLTPETSYPDCNAWIVVPGLRDALRERREAEVERRQSIRELIREIAAGRMPRGRS